MAGVECRAEIPRVGGRVFKRAQDHTLCGFISKRRHRPRLSQGISLVVQILGEILARSSNVAPSGKR